MLRLFSLTIEKSCLLFLLISLAATPVFAQFETATISGQVVDPTGLSITGAQVKLVDIDRDTSTSTTTNNSGLYTFPSVRPGRYRMEVAAVGFRVVNVTGLTVNVQDNLEQNFKLVVGSASESVTVEGGGSQVNIESATVSTVVDRHFAENLPMNGRSFQTLIELTPGVVLTPSSSYDSGQFSVNGQRSTSNYWMVDGVSANIGIGVNAGGLPGNGLAGSLGSFSAQGGTNSLVSVDAMQEFRIQTSTYAPEFGRTPGGQISIVTRSGTNQFHGTLFDYFRNDLLDANDWFAGASHLPKAKERQNDFGGTFSGPILKDRTFFFFSYEGQRLRLPQVALTNVPDLNARRTALPAMQPYLNAFPMPSPNTPDDVANGIAQFDASYSNSSTLDAYSIRIDHTFRERLALFGRFNYSPSELLQRGPNLSSLNTISPTRITIQTATVGVTWLISPRATNDLRFNYSRANASSSFHSDDFGGAVPLTSLPFPGPFTSENGLLLFAINSLQQGTLEVGSFNRNLQRQINVVDSLSTQKGSHSLKVGVDFRRLSPVFVPEAYAQDALFNDVTLSRNGNLSQSVVARTGVRPIFLFRNLGVYTQDTWRVFPRLTLTYGLRWDLDFPPQSLAGPNFPAVTGFSIRDLSKLTLAPAGTPPYKTTYGNVAPRLGIAYQLSQGRDWQTVLRGGFGVFYDLAGSEAGNSIGVGSYPFGSQVFGVGGTFPLDPAMATPLPIAPPAADNPGGLFAFDPHFQLPYTLEWNVALEQALGGQQTLSASYVGAAGRRLPQTAFVFAPNPIFAFTQLATNAGASDYNALQVHFQRRLSHGLQALTSYTWSHSLDTASAGSVFGNGANALAPALVATANRGPSDFDIRHSFSAGVTYDVPAPKIDVFMDAILRGWSLENIILARSAPPVTVSDGHFFAFQGALVTIRPDVIPGQPHYLIGSQCLQAPPLGFGQQCPGGKGFNPAAFTDPPTDANGNPIRQGNLGRNALRGFGAVQWDFAVHRDFAIEQSLRLQFRAEMFNVLNRPNFGPPFNGFGFGGFGLSTQLLGQSLNSSNQGGGGFSPLYQIGGPRSIQFALKLSF